MDKQILFLFAALNGYIDWMPVELVSIFEAEFYRYYQNDVIYLPLKSTLDFKDNFLDKDVCSFIVWYFSAYFINHAVSCYKYDSN